MALYFFDIRDSDSFDEDDRGLGLPDLDAAKAQAATTLAELARDVIPGSWKRELAINVRDERGPVLKVQMTFKAMLLRTS